MNAKQVVDSSILLAGLSAFLYASSSAKLGGYLGPLLLDPDVLGRNFQQVLYDGFVESFESILIIFLTITASLWLYSHLFLSEISRSWKIKKRIVWLKRKRYLKQKKDSQKVINAKQVTHSAAAYFTASFIFLFYLAHLEQKGKDQAAALLDRIDKKSTKKHELITLQIEGSRKTLVFLMCGDKNCAGIDPQSKEIHYFPQRHHSYSIKDHKIEKKYSGASIRQPQNRSP